MQVARGTGSCRRIGHALVSINGRPVGLYVLVEGYNKRFLKQHFKSTKGNLYDGGSGGDIARPLEVDSGEYPEDRSDLAGLLAATRETNASVRLMRLDKLLDVDRNDAWLPQIEKRLTGSKSDDTLVVVGTLHLLGADGLVEKLKAKGYKVERVCEACEAVPAQP